MANSPANRCWYCKRRKAVLWCDFMLGGAEGPPEQIPLQVDLDWDIMDRPRGAPGDYGRLLLDLRIPDNLETCDAAACLSCAQQHGWIRVGHICVGKDSETIDHCHVHATARGLGKPEWSGRDAVAAARADVRAACARKPFAVVHA